MRNPILLGIRVSSKAINWAWEQDVRPATMKLLLLAMAELANYETSFCYPSTVMLESMTGMNRKTIPGAIGKLVDAGYLVDTGKKVGRTMQVRVFQFTFLGATESSPKSGGFRKVPDSELKGARNRTSKGARNRATEPSNGNPESEPTPTPSGQGAKEYAFEGRTIRLTPPDYARWERAFTRVDLSAELVSIDAWISGLDESDRKKWFQRVSALLAKKQREAGERDRENARRRSEAGEHEPQFL